MRFAGPLNVDINEITSTLVPFPRLHFFSASLTPLVGARSVGVAGRVADSGVCERIVAQGFSNDNMLVNSDLRAGTHLAAAMLLRGPFAISDVNAAVLRQQRELRMAAWNPDGERKGRRRRGERERGGPLPPAFRLPRSPRAASRFSFHHQRAGFKVGVCSSRPLYSDAAALCISNNCAIRGPLQEGYGRFLRLYRARAHIHHYLEYISADEFQHAAENVTSLITDYAGYER
jgi:tubulin epsilon